ncbi:MAG TPA: hypothetical protein VM617_05530, partial [Thermoanaerobaculia bacterium]|nr:hypothetical protein [Thermoanaerobaculia bacterium]
MRTRRWAAALGCAGAAAVLRADSAPPAPLAAGELHAEIATVADPRRAYALYLPSAHDGERRLPVVFAFDLRDGAA